MAASDPINTRGLHSRMDGVFRHCGYVQIHATRGYNSQDNNESPWKKAALATTKQEHCNFYALLAELKSCGLKKDLQWGRRIHVKAANCPHYSNIYVVTELVRMYAKCGTMVDARGIFDTIEKPDAVSWNVLLMGYAENGDGGSTLELFSRMKEHGYAPSSRTYVVVLKACASLAANANDCEKEKYLERGREIHSQIDCQLNYFMQNTLIEMYANCGSMVEAQIVFDSVKKPDVVFWTVLLLGYADNGEGSAALKLFSRMKSLGCIPDSITYVAALKACTCLALNGDVADSLERGREIHSEIGIHMNHYVQNTLIDMYSKCGSMMNSRQVFNSMKKPDLVSWNALLLGYAENGEGLVSLDLFSRMKAFGCVPDSGTYAAVFKACALVGALTLGRKFHLEVREFTPQLVTCLLDFYAKCGGLVEAREVFDLHLRARGVPTWNALLTGYGRFGDSDCVFNLFEAMQDEGFRPDAVTFVSVLLCCSHAGLVEKAREYFKVMTLQYKVTPTVVHYTCMVDVLGRTNQINEAIAVLCKMPSNPDTVIWKSLLGACSKWKNAEIGRMAFVSLVSIDKNDGYAYVLMAQIYGSRGMWEEQERILKFWSGQTLG